MIEMQDDKSLVQERVAQPAWLEALRQIVRRLATAAGTVPRTRAAGRDPREQIEQRARVPGTKLRVLGSEAGKMILERHVFDRREPCARVPDYELDSRSQTVSGTPRRNQKPEPRSRK